MTTCDNCKYSVQDWTNPNNPDHYCKNEISDNYGYNTADLYGCEEGEDQGSMIRLNGKYTIDADRYCYTLYLDEGKTRTDKHGKEKKKREALGYYGTLDKAILGAFQFEAREMVGEGEKTLSQALSELRRAFCELEEQIKIAVPNVKVEITGGAE